MSESQSNSPSDAPRPSAGGAGRFASAAGIMVAAILLSRLLGLGREMVIANYFGAQATIVADSYRAAFRLPDLLVYMVAGGALSSAFIPIFTEYLTRDKDDDAWKLFSVFGTVVSLLLVGVILLGEIYAPQLIGNVLAPGFREYPEKLALTVALTRIILPAQLFFFLGGLMMSTLYVRNQFLVPALGPVVYNLFIILGGILGGMLFADDPQRGVFGLAWGVVVGAFVGNVLLQGWMMRRVGFRFRLSFDIRHPGVRRVALLMLPVILGLSLPQLQVILTTPFASYLQHGSIAWLDNANKMMQLPLGVFAQGLGIAVFPALAAMSARGDMDGLRRTFGQGVRAILFLTIPSSVLVILLAEPTIRLLFQRGLWNLTDTLNTAQATGFYGLSIFALGALAIINRTYYALKDTWTPMLAGTVATILYLGLNFILTPLMGHNGLALSFSISNILMMFALSITLKRRLGNVGMGDILASVGRTVLAAGAMGALVWLVILLTDHLPLVRGAEGLTVLGAALQVGLSAGLGGGLFWLVSRWLRSPETDYIVRAVRQRFPGRKRPD